MAALKETATAGSIESGDFRWKEIDRDCRIRIDRLALRLQQAPLYRSSEEHQPTQKGLIWLIPRSSWNLVNKVPFKRSDSTIDHRITSAMESPRKAPRSGKEGSSPGKASHQLVRWRRKGFASPLDYIALKGRLQKSQDHAEKVEKPQSQVNFESWKEDARVAKEELTALNRLL
ncbi:hypothetical protein RIF29_45989 [Crotalaria pallida]|uniref:Uncharacterized protein n=1 Tax=Crotalaria pallida TaxID=3830 RepID=A0AAN9HIV1_CROPI